MSQKSSAPAQEPENPETLSRHAGHAVQVRGAVGLDGDEPDRWREPDHEDQERADAVPHLSESHVKGVVTQLNEEIF